MSNQNIYSHPLFGVRARREMLGVSLKEAARAIGVQPNSFGRYERGERVICLPKAKTLARLLNCTVEQLELNPSVEELLVCKNALHEAEVRSLLDSSNTSTIAADQPRAAGRPPKPLTEQQMIRKAIDDARAEESAARLAQAGVSGTVVPQPAADPELEALMRRFSDDDEPIFSEE